MKAGTSLVIILAEYLFVLIIMLVWKHFRGEQGWIPGLLYMTYLYGSILALTASCVQFVLLSHALIRGRLFPKSALLRTSLYAAFYLASFSLGVALSLFYQQKLHALF